MPIPTGEINQAASRPESIGEILSSRDTAIETHNMPPMNITKDSNPAHFHNYCAVRVSAHSHPCLEQDVRSGLGLRLSIRVVGIGQTGMQVRNIIWRFQDDDCLGRRESNV